MARPPSDAPRAFDENVLRYVRRLLLPKVISGWVVAEYVRRAIRNGTWRALRAESRALLRALSAWRGVVRSAVLREIVEDLLLAIELGSLRGRAVAYGVALALRSGALSPLNSAERLLCLGLSYLSNPPIFKLLG